MNTVWAQRREEVLRDCLVSPDIFHQMVERLAEFVVPYQHVLETTTGKRNVHLYLQGLLSHVPGKNAEDIATFVEVERQVVQDFIGTAPPPGIINRWSRCSSDRSSSSWAHPMGSSPSIPAASPSAARIRWASSASGVATEARSTTVRWACSWATSHATTMPCWISAY